jgi:hypothetical protein
MVLVVHTGGYWWQPRKAWLVKTDEFRVDHAQYMFFLLIGGDGPGWNVIQCLLVGVFKCVLCTHGMLDPQFIDQFTSETSSSIYFGISQPCLMVSEACLWRRHGPDSAVTCESFCGPGWLYFKHFSGVIPWIVRYCEILLVYPMIFILFTSMGYKPCTVARVCPAPWRL